MVGKPACGDAAQRELSSLGMAVSNAGSTVRRAIAITWMSRTARGWRCRRQLSGTGSVLMKMRVEPFVPFAGGLFVEGLPVFSHGEADEADQLAVH